MRAGLGLVLLVREFVPFYGKKSFSHAVDGKENRHSKKQVSEHGERREPVSSWFPYSDSPPSSRTGRHKRKLVLSGREQLGWLFAPRNMATAAFSLEVSGLLSPGQ